MDEDVLSRNTCIQVQTVDMGLRQLILIPIFCCLKVQLTLFSQTVKITFLLIQFSPPSCSFLSLRLQKLSQHPIPKHLSPMSLPYRERPRFTHIQKANLYSVYITFVFLDSYHKEEKFCTK